MIHAVLNGEKICKKPQTRDHSQEAYARALLDLHPTPFRNAKQGTIRRAHRVDADDPRPERRATVLRSGRARGRLFPKAQVARRDAAEEHEEAGDDVRHGRDAHPRRSLVRCLREETQSNVFVFGQIREPISASP
jgi:hypothetical protein